MTKLKYIAATVLSVTLLAGCSGETTPSLETPKPSKTSTASPTPTVKPVPDTSPTPSTPSTPPSSSVPETPEVKPVDLPVGTVRVGSDRLSFLATDGKVKKSFTYTESPANAINYLNDVYKVQPTSKYSGELTCYGNLTSLTWESFTLTYSGTEPTKSNEYTVSFSNVATDGDPKVTTYGGTTTANSLSSVKAKLPNAPVQSYDNEGKNLEWLLEEQAASQKLIPSEDETAYGVIVHAENDKIVSVTSPISLIDMC